VDVSTPNGKNHVQRVYRSAESYMETNKLAKNAFITDGVKTIWGVVTSVAVTIAIYLGWAK